MEKSYKIKRKRAFKIFFFNSKNYFITFMFSNKIANLNTKGTTIFEIFALVPTV